MKPFLLDVNVLVALFDRAHVDHESVHRWFATKGARRWATCPITENGLLRVVTNPAYPNLEVTATQVATHLEGLIANQPNHERWPDDVSLTDRGLFALARIQGHRQLTDAYLLGLCHRHSGRLATLDRRISASCVVGGSASLIELIDS